MLSRGKVERLIQHEITCGIYSCDGTVRASVNDA
jgi:hypothetical protein